jgi:methylphosphotriester-DNA--protein-cysteine methyltransferase
VEDEESIEAIMKKFEESEKFQQELKEKQESENLTQDIEVPHMNEQQLEELFKRTSGYTVKEAMMEMSDILVQEGYLDGGESEYEEEELVI